MDKNIKEEKICPCCTTNIKHKQLFVEDNNVTYHFSCYNYMKANEQEDNE